MTEERKIILPYQEFRKRSIIFPEGNATDEQIYQEMSDNACTFQWLKERSSHVARNYHIYSKFFGKPFPGTEMIITGIHSVGGNALIYSANMRPDAVAARKHPGIKREDIQRDFNSHPWEEFSEMYQVKFSDTLCLAKCLLINKKPSMAHVEYEQRFLREGQVMMEIDSPYVPKVFYADKNVIGQRRIIYTRPLELLKSTERTLEERLITGENAVAIFADINRRRIEEGKLPISHRDITGTNLLISTTNDLSVYAIDFGMVTDPNRPLPEANKEKQFKTGGMLLGTPAYIPREVLVSGDLTEYVNDVYSLGVILYLLMTGGLPFKGTNFSEILSNITTWNDGRGPTPPNTVDPRIPMPLSSLIMRALSKRPEDRYQNVIVFYDAIKRVRESISFPKSEQVGVMTDEQMLGTPTLVIAERERVSNEIRSRRSRTKDIVKKDIKEEMGAGPLPSRTMVIGSSYAKKPQQPGRKYERFTGKRDIEERLKKEDDNSNSS